MEHTTPFRSFDMTPDVPPHRCEELKHPNMSNFVVSCLIIIGLVISYMPQMWRIISRKSSEGLSPYFIMLGAVAGTCAVANILMLPTSHEDISCCKHNSPFACTAALLGVAQIGLQWSCFFVIMFLFLIFLPRQSVQDHIDGPVKAEGKEVYEALAVVGVAMLHFFVTLVLSIIVMARFSKYTKQWADFLGLCTGVLAAVQYLPQIWTTWRLQHVGSLSIPMMLIQTPGGYVFAASLYARLGASNWSAWVPYVLLASLQGVLLSMALYFEYRDRRVQPKGSPRGQSVGFLGDSSGYDGHGSDDEGGHHVEGEGDNEEDPLLWTERRRSSRDAIPARRRETQRSDSNHSAAPQSKKGRGGKDALSKLRGFGTVG